MAGGVSSNQQDRRRPPPRVHARPLAPTKPFFLMPQYLTAVSRAGRPPGLEVLSQCRLGARSAIAVARIIPGQPCAHDQHGGQERDHRPAATSRPPISHGAGLTRQSKVLPSHLQGFMPRSTSS